MARIHGVMLVLKAGWRRGGGYELSWCKDTPPRWMRPGHHSITGLPVWLGEWKALDSRDSWRTLVLRAGWRCVGGVELSWCKDTPTRWMRPGNHSITGLPVYVGLGSGKRLTAGIHGVCLSSGQAGDALAGSNFPGVKILPTRWMRPGHSSITGLPALFILAWDVEIA